MVILAALIVAGVLTALAQKRRDSVEQVRPRRASTQGGTLIEVGARGNFQAALNTAQCGDTIVLQAGATYQASGSDKGFVFPAKNCSSYITVQTSNLAGLPADGQRVQMSDAAAMAKIVPSVVGGNTHAAMTFVANAKFWKLIGVEVTTLVGQPYCSVLVDVGPYVAWAEAPSDLVFDRRSSGWCTTGPRAASDAR